MKHLLFGVLLGLVLVFPHLAGQGAAPAATAARWAACQPAVWAFTAGAVTRPWIARRFAHLTRRSAT